VFRQSCARLVSPSRRLTTQPSNLNGASARPATWPQRLLHPNRVQTVAIEREPTGAERPICLLCCSETEQRQLPFTVLPHCSDSEQRRLVQILNSAGYSGSPWPPAAPGQRPLASNRSVDSRWMRWMAALACGDFSQLPGPCRVRHPESTSARIFLRTPKVSEKEPFGAPS